MDECGELVRYANAGQWSEAARRKMLDFLESRGWPQEEAVAIARRRWEERTPIHKMCGSPVYCEVCGRRSAGVTDEGWRCEEHLNVTNVEPTFDWRSGFMLNDATVSPASPAG